MRATLVYNPGSGEGGHGRDRLLSSLHGAGRTIDAVAKEDDYPAALRDPGDLVIVAGGDGTVQKVAVHLVGRSVPVALLSLGTANNVASAVGPWATPRALAEALDRGATRERPLDAGTADGPWGRALFFEAFGFGAFPRLMPLVSEVKSEVDADGGGQRELAFDRRAFLRALDAIGSQRFAGTLDEEPVEDDLLLLEVMNTPTMGPRFRLAPQADPGDGLLDVVVARASDRARLADCLSGGPASGAAALDVRRARELAFRWEGAPVHADSRIWAWPAEWAEKPQAPPGAPAGEVRVGIRAGALRVLVPRDS